MKKTIFMATLVLLASGVSYSGVEKKGKDIEAITTDKKKVVLHADGKWEYAKTEVKTVNQSDYPRFSKPASANDSVKGKKVPYEVSFNNAKWNVLAKPLNESAEYSLTHAEGDGYAMVISERISISVDHLQNIVMENLESVSENAQLARREKRIVNGKEVTFLEITGTMQGINFVYYYYLYSDKNGTIQIAVFTSDALIEEYKADFEDILNGFVVVEKK